MSECLFCSSLLYLQKSIVVYIIAIIMVLGYWIYIQGLDYQNVQVR